MNGNGPMMMRGTVHLLDDTTLTTVDEVREYLNERGTIVREDLYRRVLVFELDLADCEPVLSDFAAVAAEQAIKLLGEGPDGEVVSAVVGAIEAENTWDEIVKHLDNMFGLALTDVELRVHDRIVWRERA